MYDVIANDTGIVSAFEAAGIKAVRWPGGSWSDAYNWETNTECGNYAATGNTFANFVSDIAIPAGLDVALTADYGTGKNCTGPGDPNRSGILGDCGALPTASLVSHMTVGNEEYGELGNRPRILLKNNAALPMPPRHAARKQRLLCVGQSGLSGARWSVWT